MLHVASACVVAVVALVIAFSEGINAALIGAISATANTVLLLYGTRKLGLIHRQAAAATEQAETAATAAAEAVVASVETLERIERRQ